MVLAPWNDPTPLQWGWCLFDIYGTIITRSQFEVDITQASRKEFLLNNISDPDGAINRILATIDVAKSECFKQEVKERIFEIVRQEVGVSEINSMIFECMRTWVIDAIERAKASIRCRKPVSTLQFGCCLCKPGKLRKGWTTIYGGVSGKEASGLRGSHPNTFDSLNNLALVYNRQGKYGDAERLYMECLEKRRVVLGESHPNTLQSLKMLAKSYLRHGKYDQFEPLFLKFIEKKGVVAAESHLSNVESMLFHANVYFYHGNFFKAAVILIVYLEKSEVEFGVNHPKTVTARKKFAYTQHRPI